MYPKTWPPSLHLIEKLRNSALKYYKHWISYCTYNVAEATDAHALSTRSHLFLPWKTLTSGWEFKEERRGTAGHPPPVPWKVRWFLWSRAPALCYLICSFQLLKWCRHTAYDDKTHSHPSPQKLQTLRDTSHFILQVIRRHPQTYDELDRESTRFGIWKNHRDKYENEAVHCCCVSATISPWLAAPLPAWAVAPLPACVAIPSLTGGGTPKLVRCTS